MHDEIKEVTMVTKTKQRTRIVAPGSFVSIPKASREVHVGLRDAVKVEFLSAYL
jgi:hypothetical protein